MNQDGQQIRVTTIAGALRRLHAADEADQLERLARSGRLLWALASTSHMSLYELAHVALTAGIELTHKVPASTVVTLVGGTTMSAGRVLAELQCALRALEQLGEAADAALLEKPARPALVLIKGGRDEQPPSRRGAA